MTVYKIADQIKELLNGINENLMHDKMLKHYQALHLVDENGSWVLKQLQEISDQLLDRSWTENRTKAFIDEIAGLTIKNEYLNNFLELFKDEDLSISEKLDNKDDVIIPEIVAFAIALQQLTRAINLDTSLMMLLVGHFKKLRSKSDTFKYTSFFHKMKLLSVEKSITTKMVSFDTGIVHPKIGSWLLPINILEAGTSDYLDGFKDNAHASRPLIMNRPGASEDRYTGAGPSRWSEDKKAICYAMPLPQQWSDLYQTWNMAFISKFPRFLYMLPKLLIPQVADYQAKPMEFMNNRGYALYITLMYGGLNFQKWKEREDDFIWSDKRLTTLWGKANLESANKYSGEVLRRKKARELFFS
jgi:hypothetical protein